jgi:hypothetical protein
LVVHDLDSTALNRGERCTVNTPIDGDFFTPAGAGFLVDMTRTGPVFRGFSLRRPAAVAAATTLLLAVAAAGCGAVDDDSLAGPSAASSTTAGAATGPRMVLRFDHAVVPATLADTAAGREFAGSLPLTLELRDPMGQAKSGPLPARIDATGSDRVYDPDAGGIYYVPGNQTLAVFYDDLGQSVPAPGLVRLGAVEGDLASIAGAGNRVRVRVDLVDQTSS